jgi:hypothetical protein
MEREYSRQRIGWGGYVLLLVAILICFVPTASKRFVVDYGHPSSVTFKQNQVKTLVAEVEYKQGIKESLEVVGKTLHIPVKLTWPRVYGFCVVLCYLYIRRMRKAFNFDYEKDALITVGIFLGAWLTVLAINLAISYNITDHYAAAIKATQKDPAKLQLILDAIASGITEDFTLNPFIIAVVVMAIALIANWVFNTEFVQDIKSEINKAICLALLRNNQDVIISEVVRSNRAEYEGLAEQVSSGVLSGVEVVQLMADGTVELVCYNCRLDWKPLPILSVNRQVLRQLSFDNFYRLLSAGAKENAFAELREKIMERNRLRFKEKAGKKAVKAMLNSVSEKAMVLLKKRAAEQEAMQLKTTTDRTARILERAYTLALRKYRDDLAKMGIEELQSFLNPLRVEIAKAVRSACEEINRRTARGRRVVEDLLPANTRLYLERGARKIFVFEEAPQRRSIHASRHICHERDGRRFFLAFPYTIFVVVLSDNSFYELYVLFNNKPLTSLQDTVYAPSLPNTNGNTRICMSMRHEAEDPVVRAQEVVSHYWQSTFNSDLSHFFDEYRQRDARLRDLYAWEKSSEADPRFFLRVPLIPVGRLEEIIQSAIDDRDSEGIIDVSRMLSLVDQAFADKDDFGSQLKRKLVEGKVVKAYPDIARQAINDHLSEFIKALSGQMSGVLKEAYKAAPERANLYNRLMDSVDAVLGEDFAELAREVLLRRRVSADQLIENIKQQ